MGLPGWDTLIFLLQSCTKVTAWVETSYSRSHLDLVKAVGKVITSISPPLTADSQFSA